MGSRAMRGSCFGVGAHTRTRVSGISSLLPCSIRQTRSRDPDASVKKVTLTCAPTVETPWSFRPRLAAFTIRRPFSLRLKRNTATVLISRGF
jgi:hypothetical protein